MHHNCHDVGIVECITIFRVNYSIFYSSHSKLVFCSTSCSVPETIEYRSSYTKLSGIIEIRIREMNLLSQTAFPGPVMEVVKSMFSCVLV
jgi:hypothetical protein